MKRIPAILILLLAATPAAAADLDVDLVRDAITVAAERALPETISEVEVHTVFVRGSVDVPAGVTPEVRVRAAGDMDWIGKVSVDVDVTVGGQLLESVRVTATVAAYVRVAVLSNPVGRGQAITEADISVASRDAAGLPGGVVSDPARLLGRTPRRDLSLGALVRERDLEERVDAERNQPVTLLISAGSLRITAPGLLRADARVGDLVEVFATDTKTIVYGVLVAPRLVEVPTADATATTASRSAR